MSRPLVRRLMDAPLTCHHRRVGRSSDLPRLAFVALTYRLLDRLDGGLTDHGARPGVSDAVGWALMAEKPV